jgi:hypothetical protein
LPTPRSRGYNPPPKASRELSSTEWREKSYEDAFQGALSGLAARRRTDPSFSIGDAEGTLRHLYVQEGNDQGGRGPLQDAILEATIAAYERYIELWRKEGTDPAPPPRKEPPHEHRDP